MADSTDTAGGTGTTATAPAATSTPGTTQATTGAAGTAAAAGTTSGATDTTGSGATGTAATPTPPTPPPLDTLLSGLETLGSEVIDLGLPSMSLQVSLPLGDGSKASLALYLTPPAAATTSGTAPKGGSLDDVISSVRTAVNDSATFGETMTVEQGYVCVTSLQRT